MASKILIEPWTSFRKAYMRITHQCADWYNADKLYPCVYYSMATQHFMSPVVGHCWSDKDSIFKNIVATFGLHNNPEKSN